MFDSHCKLQAMHRRQAQLLPCWYTVKCLATRLNHSLQAHHLFTPRHLNPSPTRHRSEFGRADVLTSYVKCCDRERLHVQRFMSKPQGLEHTRLTHVWLAAPTPPQALHCCGDLVEGCKAATERLRSLPVSMGGAPVAALQVCVHAEDHKMIRTQSVLAFCLSPNQQEFWAGTNYTLNAYKEAVSGCQVSTAVDSVQEAP